MVEESYLYVAGGGGGGGGTPKSTNDVVEESYLYVAGGYQRAPMLTAL